LLELIVVDNASSDATRQIIERDAAGWARSILLSDQNDGFARGCNRGFEKVRTPYALFLNPDAVIEPDALRTLLDFMQDQPAVGIVGPAIIEGEQSTELQDTGARPTPWTALRNAAPIRRKRTDSWPIVPGSAPRRTGWVCGAVLLVRTELMRQLDGFDPRFFLYWEEMDLCLRAEARGFEIWAVGTAAARHIGGASTSRDDTRVAGCIAKHYYQSRYYYMVKHHGRLLATVAELGEFVLLAARSVADGLRGRGMHKLRPRLQASLLSGPRRV
jgi:N-acetylglucosaminyl-diphospho-decaprenol L-rhamnosyltransferase